MPWLYLWHCPTFEGQNAAKAELVEWMATQPVPEGAPELAYHQGPHAVIEPTSVSAAKH